MPGDPPVTMPVDEPTVATVMVLLVHVPPPLALASVVVKPVHTKRLPVIGVDNANIVAVTGILSLGHPATTCDTYHVVTPTAAVEGVGAVVDPTPPVGVVHQYMVPMPLAESGTDVDPTQYDTLDVVGGGVVPGGMTVSKNVFPEHPDTAVVPVTVYVIGLVIELTATVVEVPVVAER